ncbi:hypothetical protein P5673_023490 [Acropora cervicornis]|uniref:Uncharacterized protein n=1 Tax=Acropora cervicornis TaxID=6130 RepID=A0AAD9Q548_ACRCE|nr:hypothetical protein P5673_023490 [Acropora cervicornis]
MTLTPNMHLASLLKP